MLASSFLLTLFVLFVAMVVVNELLWMSIMFHHHEKLDQDITYVNGAAASRATVIVTSAQRRMYMSLEARGGFLCRHLTQTFPDSTHPSVVVLQRQNGKWERCRSTGLSPARTARWRTCDACSPRGRQATLCALFLNSGAAVKGLLPLRRPQWTGLNLRMCGQGLPVPCRPCPRLPQRQVPFLGWLPWPITSPLWRTSTRAEPRRNARPPRRGKRRQPKGAYRRPATEASVPGTPGAQRRRSAERQDPCRVSMHHPCRRKAHRLPAAL